MSTPSFSLGACIFCFLTNSELQSQALRVYSEAERAFFQQNNFRAHVSRINRYDIEWPLPIASFVREAIG